MEVQLLGQIKESTLYQQGHIPHILNFKAETQYAIQKATKEQLQNTNQIKTNVVILTDALSVLGSLKNHKKGPYKSQKSVS